MPKRASDASKKRKSRRRQPRDRPRPWPVPPRSAGRRAQELLEHARAQIVHKQLDDAEWTLDCAESLLDARVPPFYRSWAVRLRGLILEERGAVVPAFARLSQGLSMEIESMLPLLGSDYFIDLCRLGWKTPGGKHVWKLLKRLEGSPLLLHQLGKRLGPRLQELDDEARDGAEAGKLVVEVLESLVGEAGRPE